MTTLKELKALGGLVSDKPARKEISFTIDDTDYTAAIHVRQLSVGDYETVFMAMDSKSRTAKVIAEAIRLGDEGKDRISYEEAYKLHPSLSAAMIEAFNEVNVAKKSSRPATVSSAN